MAPTKRKTSDKKAKIKSVKNSQKRVKKKRKTGDKRLRKSKKSEKLNEHKNGPVSQWLDTCKYELPGTSYDNASLYSFRQDEDSVLSEKQQKEKKPSSKDGILKKKKLSSDSFIRQYIKSGMDHVASFIVESAIRFGQKHGVVVPDENMPEVYEIISPSHDEMYKKIRFKIPSKFEDYDENTNATWRSHIKDIVKAARRRRSSFENQSVESEKNSKGSLKDSIDDVIPLLENMAEYDTTKKSDQVDQPHYSNSSEGDIIVEEETENDSTKPCKRPKNGNSNSGNVKTDEKKAQVNKVKKGLKKIRRDSLELGRQRLKSGNIKRKRSVCSSVS